MHMGPMATRAAGPVDGLNVKAYIGLRTLSSR
jgi:hypothetical protein